MRYMNDYDIERAAHQHRSHEILGPAVLQLIRMETYANQNSDGWCYWPKPARAANKLMELIQGVPFARCSNCYRVGSHEYSCDRPEVTVADLRKALVPIKAFRTRELAVGRGHFEIVEV